MVHRRVTNPLCAEAEALYEACKWAEREGLLAPMFECDSSTLIGAFSPYRQETSRSGDQD